MDTDWQRAFTPILAGLILACGLTALASAQTPAPKQEPAPEPNLPAPARPATPPQTTPSHLAGVEADKIVRWTLKDAIMAALEKNPDIEIARHNVRLSQFDILAAQGAYDPITSSTLNYASQKAPNVSRFSGSSQNFLQNDAFGYNLGYSKLVERTGGSYQVNFNNSRLTSNTASLATSYNPTLTAALTQPLMKNLGIDSNRHLIQIAKKKLDLSDAQFRQQVIQIITDVQEAYWNLAFAIRSEEIQRDALRLAGKQLENNREQLKVGTLAQLDVINASAQVENVRQLDAQLRKQLQTIEADVRAAYHAVEAAGLRYGAARAAREYAERQLAGEQEKFSVGLSTTFLVLTRQNDLSQARGAEAQALTDYNKATAVLFTIPEDSLNSVLRRLRSGERLPSEAYDRSGQTKLVTGRLLTMDNQIDPNTGTNRLKAVFENKGNALFPNQFVNIRLLVETRKDKVLIPVVAIQRGPRGTYVYVVRPDQTVEARPVAVGAMEGDDASIESGLTANEQVVVAGVDKRQPGGKVRMADCESVPRAVAASHYQ